MSPIVFVFFTNDYSTGRVLSSATLCNQSITLMNVEASVDIASSNLTNVRRLSNLTVGQGPFTQYAGNITGAPLYGRAYNGINWTNITQGDEFVGDRAGAIQQQLDSTVFQYILGAPGGLTRAENATFGLLAKTVYVSFSPHGPSPSLINCVQRNYLTILAKQLYFIDAPQPMQVLVSTFQKRLFLAYVTPTFHEKSLTRA
jgi:hypothetical protein